jgi:hypothetical protein
MDPVLVVVLVGAVLIYLISEDKVLTFEEKTRYAQLTLDYCAQVLFHNLNTPVPLIQFSINPNKNYAEYDPSTRTITVFEGGTTNKRLLVEVIIHEYTHHVQYSTRETRQYKELLDQNGYRKHPWEVEARRNASQHARACLATLRKY